MEVEGIWFDLLVSGAKPIEGKTKSPKWENLKPGQLITITNKETHETRLFYITHINEYNNLVDYLVVEGLDRCLPGITSFKEAIEIYQKWSAVDELKEYNFLAIGMKVFNDFDSYNFYESV